ncbi:hypothetical protein RB25_04630 [Herbaspirillum rubrisubalbicans]|uniref:Uncharacterized protein n=2 Tax=Herbaspirillum rubrisubalbicans TaxID=80842 RepID=A0ABX9BWM2_9BURK|nr:hypothetical protein [Herbaspirillum rubrisubalbicans]MCP1576784.1 hypothetical protein [Herbaspirillum rubrisubalbicans]QJQ00015.1 hypothetical protein C798_07150 [Herbaspirillum rubrisubalbicans Os34]RAM62308.1 hypothetical protein RB24_21230 [Herbaspirillum rubrisubalbicans]RAN49667.1 hypothetical protein RB25_04630 [Herbaspirillum rubrisubalbicans]
MISKRYAARTFIVALAFLSGTIAVSVYPFKLSDPNVTIEVYDRRYACGECYLEFGISKIEGADESNRQNSPYRFEGWDVLVLFRGSDSFLSRYQDRLFEKNPACTWPTFRLTGQFKRRLIYALNFNGDHYDGLYFDANSGVALNTEPSCKTVARETALP